MGVKRKKKEKRRRYPLSSLSRFLSQHATAKLTHAPENWERADDVPCHTSNILVVLVRAPSLSPRHPHHRCCCCFSPWLFTSLSGQFYPCPRMHNTPTTLATLTTLNMLPDLTTTTTFIPHHCGRHHRRRHGRRCNHDLQTRCRTTSGRCPPAVGSAWSATRTSNSPVR